MTPPCCRSSTSTIFILLLLLALASINIISSSIASTSSFNSIISFGDSLADTGNKLHLSESVNNTSHNGFPPYGESFFRHPTGRYSDGRIIIDFIAEYLGLPFLAPYFGKNGTKKQEFGEGVNYAVGGATALDYSYLVERGIINTSTNVSLGTQLVWFKQMFANACHTFPGCKKILQNSLVLMGEIGGNDICYAFFQGKTKQEAQSLFVPIIKSISLAVNELIELGAVTIVVPGNLPIGCLTVFLAYFYGSDKQDYDPSTGCITWLNNFSQNYNEKLQAELKRIQGLHPHATIIYADYYNAAFPMFTSPQKYGFERAFTACCGAGGPYNYNSSLESEHFGLPLVPPYFGANGTKMKQFGEGVNFAVAAATALDCSVLKEKGIINGKTNVSLSTQLGWCKDMLASSCSDTFSNCKRFLQNSLVLLGGIGGNDFYYGLSQGKTKEELYSLIPLVINSISLAINELIELGAMTLLVPGHTPRGCLTTNLAYYNDLNKEDYDPSTGCIIWLNELTQQYNKHLQIKLDQIQKLHPHANITYADYYNSAMQLLYTSPEKYGFTNAFTACCGAGGGQYNYNPSVGCKCPLSTSCEDPSAYVNWDGVHFTEAAYRVIANGLLKGSSSISPINNACSSIPVNEGRGHLEYEI